MRASERDDRPASPPPQTPQKTVRLKVQSHESVENRDLQVAPQQTQTHALPHERGMEARPLSRQPSSRQGSRLTMWELSSHDLLATPNGGNSEEGDSSRESVNSEVGACVRPHSVASYAVDTPGFDESGYDEPDAFSLTPEVVQTRNGSLFSAVTPATAVVAPAPTLTEDATGLASMPDSSATDSALSPMALAESPPSVDASREQQPMERSQTEQGESAQLTGVAGVDNARIADAAAHDEAHVTYEECGTKQSPPALASAAHCLAPASSD
eukprot:2937288-Pleurochrysis_carterae.AAC.1